MNQLYNCILSCRWIFPAAALILAACGRMKKHSVRRLCFLAAEASCVVGLLVLLLAGLSPQAASGTVIPVLIVLLLPERSQGGLS
ncbi:MAG: hypothetical protein IKE03_10545 [Blautia sp.]|nr:hypothetical protein [Blautia sp.]